MTPPAAAARPVASARRTIYVVRHAIAAERGDQFPDDSLRPLTGKGIPACVRSCADLPNSIRRLTSF